MRKIFSNFVCFSESPNFTKNYIQIHFLPKFDFKLSIEIWNFAESGLQYSIICYQGLWWFLNLVDCLNLSHGISLEQNLLNTLYWVRQTKFHWILVEPQYPQILKNYLFGKWWCTVATDELLCLKNAGTQIFNVFHLKWIISIHCNLKKYKFWGLFLS